MTKEKTEPDIQRIVGAMKLIADLIEGNLDKKIEVKDVIPFLSKSFDAVSKAHTKTAFTLLLRAHEAKEGETIYISDEIIAKMWEYRVIKASYAEGHKIWIDFIDTSKFENPERLDIFDKVFFREWTAKQAGKVIKELLAGTRDSAINLSLYNKMHGDDLKLFWERMLPLDKEKFFNGLQECEKSFTRLKHILGEEEFEKVQKLYTKSE